MSLKEVVRISLKYMHDQEVALSHFITRFLYISILRLNG